uniref:Uncharacterized protein n=1 Tax=Malacoplasma iowae 695 TaxID=1048830 RepID=A0A6P1LBG6_MALIO
MFKYSIFLIPKVLIKSWNCFFKSDFSSSLIEGFILSTKALIKLSTKKSFPINCVITLTTSCLLFPIISRIGSFVFKSFLMASINTLLSGNTFASINKSTILLDDDSTNWATVSFFDI